MSTIKESVGNVRLLLDTPREQKPNVRQIFGSVLREYQNAMNELANSNVMWSLKETTVTLTGQADKLVGSNIGKILFVTANQDNPYLVDFTDLRDTSAYWWDYYPIASERPQDYNYAGYPYYIAFYHKDGQLYLRSPVNYLAGEVLTITSAVGDWTSNVSAGSSAVLSQYHHLPEIRAAMNLAHNARWTDSEEADLVHIQGLLQSLAMQEQRVYEQFRIHKRSLVADDVVYIQDQDCYF